VEEAGDVDRQVVVVVGMGEFDERLGDEDAGVVDQRVDAPKERQRLADDALGGRRVGDVAGDGENVRVTARRDRPRVGDDAVVAIAVGPNQLGAEPLGRAGNDVY